MTTSQPCVSPGTGTLSPDLRVFYQYGMVLGLDDFLQEQTHNLGLDYHHERALHGYGTVYGLHVTATPSDAGDVTVTVEPGMAVDQWGREVTVPSAQCARLGAWLAAQEEASPGAIAAHLDDSGELVVYITIAYAECPDDLVPLPGQPCSTSAQAQVPSRLRDAWDIELAWAIPKMPAWDAVRQLAGLLNSVQIVPGLDPSLSSEPAIIEAVLALPALGTPSGSPPGPGPYQLPAGTADDAFDRILTAWVTQVRPQLAPDLTAPDPAWDPSILLCAITLTPQMPFSTANPVISSHSDPDDSGRPYLLHTGLIQELRLGSGGGAPPAQEAVTLSATADAGGVPTLTAWFHLGVPVELPGAVQVADENGQEVTFTATAASGTPFAQVWTLTPQGSMTVADGDQLAVTFPGTQVLVGNSASTLAAALAGQGFLGTTSSGDLTAYTAVRVLCPASAPFVTVTFVPVDNAYLELWFHLQPAGLAENVVMVSPAVQVVNDLTGAVLFPPSGGSQTPTPTTQQNIWMIPASALPGDSPPYLRVVVDTGASTVSTPSGQMTLAQWIATSGIRYVGWEDPTIVSFTRITFPASAPTGAVRG